MPHKQQPFTPNLTRNSLLRNSASLFSKPKSLSISPLSVCLLTIWIPLFMTLFLPSTVRPCHPTFIVSLINWHFCITVYRPLFSLTNATLIYSLRDSFIAAPRFVRYHPSSPLTSLTAYNIHPFLPDNNVYTLSPGHGAILKWGDHSSLSYFLWHY